jgi:hypothetical protein
MEACSAVAVPALLALARMCVVGYGCRGGSARRRQRAEMAGWITGPPLLAVVLRLLASRLASRSAPWRLSSAALADDHRP